MTSIPTGIDFQIIDNLEFINQIAYSHTINGISNGIFILAIIYSGLFFLILRKRIYLYYFLYVFNFWIFMITVNHETPTYFSWLDLPFSFGYYIIPHYLLTIGLILYARELLDLKKLLPIIYKINIGIVCGICILLGLYLAFDWSWQDSMVNTIALIPSFIASIILVFKKYKPAWFTFIGISLIFVAFLNLKFELIIYLPVFFIFSIYGVIEIIIFGISLTYWWKTLSIEKEKALQIALISADEITTMKENQNKILEEQVTLKTEALNIANQQLSIYIKQVEQLNISLETDNDKLKVKVIDQIKARSDDKIMNFEDFKINFPDESSCYQYVENIKWLNGFKCYKCEGSKFSNCKLANNAPARRCTKCGFVNSVSSYTLYHNIKFPLQKAFYITYMIGTDKLQTLESLSKELDLRIATIHSFLKRVKEARNAYKSKKKHKDGWSHLIEYDINQSIKKISESKDGL